MCKDCCDKSEIEQVIDSIAAMMDGDCWAGPSPYRTEVIDGNVVVTCIETGNKYYVTVLPESLVDMLRAPISIKKKTSELYCPDAGLKGCG